MNKYEIVDHTADVAIKAYGKNISECFSNAAKAMFDIITDKSEIDTVGEYKIEISSDDLEQLLVDWLSELLFLNTAKNLVFSFFNVEINEKNCTLKADVFGEKYDISKHKIGQEIKAVTYHILEVRNKRPYHVQVLFDI